MPSLKIIEPDGSFIKKEQILELKRAFSKQSQYTKESIYIIKNCEKMNKDSANTMLKFLEEPDGQVIGFFVTNYEDNVLSTIKSRCQLINVQFKNEVFEEFSICEEKFSEYLEIVEKYLKSIEDKDKNFILNNKIYLGNYSKEEIKIIFSIILKIYKQEFYSRCSKKEYERYDFLNKLTTQNITTKINYLIEILGQINYNLNLDLLLDRFLIEMDGINNEAL